MTDEMWVIAMVGTMVGAMVVVALYALLGSTEKNVKADKLIDLAIRVLLIILGFVEK